MHAVVPKFPSVYKNFIFFMSSHKMMFHSNLKCLHVTSMHGLNIELCMCSSHVGHLCGYFLYNFLWTIHGVTQSLFRYWFLFVNGNDFYFHFLDFPETFLKLEGTQIIKFKKLNLLTFQVIRKIIMAACWILYDPSQKFLCIRRVYTFLHNGMWMFFLFFSFLFFFLFLFFLQALENRKGFVMCLEIMDILMWAFMVN